MINCAQCGQPITDNDGVMIEKHASVATKNFVFHPTMECAGAFEHREAIKLGLVPSQLKLVEEDEKKLEETTTTTKNHGFFHGMFGSN